MSLNKESVLQVLIITVRNEVAKVMFSQACVCRRGGGGVSGPGGCVVPGRSAPGGVCSKGGAWSQGGPGPGPRGVCIPSFTICTYPDITCCSWVFAL